MKSIVMRILPLFWALSFFASNQLFAATIQFEGVISPGVEENLYGPYTEAGYTLTSPGGSALVSPTNYYADWYGPTTGSVHYTSLIGISTDAVLTLARADGKPFRLDSFDAGKGTLSNDLNEKYIISGLTADYHNFEYIFSINDYQWHTFSFSNNPDFASVRQLSIAQYYQGYESTFAIDNINVTAVPLPASAWLFGSAVILVVLGFKTRNCDGGATVTEAMVSGFDLFPCCEE